MMLCLVLPFVIWYGGWVMNYSPVRSGGEVSTSFECGFSAMGAYRRNFSLYFFQLLLIFLVFDAEILVLLPLPEMVILPSMGFLGVVGFFVVLVGGLYHEWREGSLERPSWWLGGSSVRLS